METTTQFDLNTAIQHWRETLNQSPGLRTENITELEAHLRDSIANWQTKGLSAEESFLIATRRLGSASALESEFAKVNTKEVWLDRLLWMVVGVQLVWLLTAISSFMARWAVIGGLTGLGYKFNYHFGQPLKAAIMPGLLLTFVQTVVCVLAAWGGWLFILRKDNVLSTIANRLLQRRFITGVLVVGGSVLLLRNLALLDYLLLLKKWFSDEKYGYLNYSWAMAGWYVWIVASLIPAAVTVFLARRRVRQRLRTVR
jgi:hypothetical protein